MECSPLILAKGPLKTTRLPAHLEHPKPRAAATGARVDLIVPVFAYPPTLNNGPFCLSGNKFAREMTDLIIQDGQNVQCEVHGNCS